MVTSNKIRVYELSKQLDLSNKEVMDLLQDEFGVTVKSHASSIDADVAEKLVKLKQNGHAATPAPQPEKAKVAAQVASKPEAKPEAKPEPKSVAAQAPPKPAAKPEPKPEPKPVAAQAVPQPAAKPESKPESRPEPKPVAAQAAPRPAAKPEPKPEPKPELKQAAAKVAPPVVDAALEEEEDTSEPIKIENPVTVRELAVLIGKRETELVKHMFMKGVMITVNETLPVDDALTLSRELEVNVIGPDRDDNRYEDGAPELRVTEAKGKNLSPRAPVVSIMGHVDHGKTSLLDAIRQTRHKIVEGEAGGITQSIGAYTVNWEGHDIVFLDTPGHEAFTAMRMRGAQSTDIAILVVAADDGVMPQTREAINHARAANIPIIVAVNKIDKEDADPDRVLLQLSEMGLNPEKWGGDTLTVEVSAIKRTNLDELLETINLVAELQELKADTTLPAEGVVIEAERDKGKGPVATVLVQSGTLRIGDNILIGAVSGRVRALIDDHGNRVDTAGPSTPVEVLGFNEVPHAGDLFEVIPDDKQFKQRVAAEQNKEREQRFAKKAAPGLISEKESQDFYLILKADTQGSLEAVSNAILQLATEEVAVNILHAGTGDISESDVMLSSANDAVIIGFNVKAEPGAHRMIVDQNIRVKLYDVIYHITEDAEKMMLGLLAPEQEEELTGKAEVRQLFSVGKKVIAGCYIIEGKVHRNGIAKVVRGKQEIFTGNLDQLKRFKDDVKEVQQGYECGISFDKFNELQEGDIIENYVLKEIQRTSLT
ncbi:MAG: translation initiation factor IF-2 [Cyanobacteria bacterium HKST-UBA04]|nr:translation initiation factor IF-2 [Cyanobacteria bacterium HKST-UBA04]